MKKSELVKSKVTKDIVNLIPVGIYASTEITTIDHPNGQKYFTWKLAAQRNMTKDFAAAVDKEVFLQVSDSHDREPCGEVIIGGSCLEYYSHCINGDMLHEYESLDHAKDVSLPPKSLNLLEVEVSNQGSTVNRRLNNGLQQPSITPVFIVDTIEEVEKLVIEAIFLADSFDIIYNDSRINVCVDVDTVIFKALVKELSDELKVVRYNVQNVVYGYSQQFGYSDVAFHVKGIDGDVIAVIPLQEGEYLENTAMSDSIRVFDYEGIPYTYMSRVEINQHIIDCIKEFMSYDR